VFYSNGNVSDLLGNTTRSTRRVGGFDTYSPSAQSYLFPMKTGNSWSLKLTQVTTDGEGRKRTTDVKVKLRVVGEEEVEPVAGKMRAMRVERVAEWKQRGSDSAGVRTQTFWYSGPVKRWVRMEDKNVTSAGKILQHEVWDLVGYKVQ
jgi:hypothetical protein